jgi:ABC-type amino acid transport substrate-binding protein
MKTPAIICLLLLMLAGCESPTNPRLTMLTEESAPLNFAADGKIQGQAVDVVEALLERTGGKMDMQLLPWDQAYQQVLNESNTALFSTMMTPERKAQLQWVGPINTMDTSLYALKGSGLQIRTLDEAKSAGKIATVKDYYSEQVLKQQGFGNLDSQPNEEAAIRKLLAGEVQLFVGNNTVLPALLRKVGADMSQLEIVFTVSTDLGYIAFSPSTSPELVAKWQQALDAMKRDGSFDSIYAKWLPEEIPPGILQMMTEEYPPVTFLHQGRPAGFVTDMVREIALRLQYADNIRLTSWKNAYNMTRLHPNVVLFSAERTPEREALFQWVGPVGQNRSILYARKGADIKVGSLDEAKALKAIATTTDWFTEQHLKREGFGNLVSSKEPTENVRQLMDGEVQLSIFTDITIPEIAAEAGYSMADLEPVLTVSQTDFYIALSKDTPEAVVTQWQTQLDKMKQDGSFERIYRSYLPEAALGELLQTQ